LKERIMTKEESTACGYLIIAKAFLETGQIQRTWLALSQAIFWLRQ